MHAPADTDIASSIYLLQEKLGEGGMGVVYRAIHRLSGRQVALKCVHARESASDTAPDPDAEASTRAARLGLRLSLVHEFQMLASLHHPNIVTVFDFGFNAQQRPFFTMELLPAPQSILEEAAGQSVRAKVARLVQLLQALAYLHRRGIFHRGQFDMKSPSRNVNSDAFLEKRWKSCDGPLIRRLSRDGAQQRAADFSGQVAQAFQELG